MNNNRIRSYTGTAALLLIVLAASWGMVAAARSAEEPLSSALITDDGACVALDPTNLLQNGSFEGEYTQYVPNPPIAQCPAGVCTSVRTPDGWSPWWTTKGSDPLFYKMPEFTAAAHDYWYGPPRTRSGESAQQLFTLFSTHEAGVFQQIQTTPGVTYCFSAWGQSWSAQDDPIPELNHSSCPSSQGVGDACSGPEDGQLNQKIGIDPTGGTDPESGSIVWSESREQYDSYGMFVVTATAQAETITVFTYANPDFPVKHNNAYWDDAVVSAPRMVINGLSDMAVMTLPSEIKTVSNTGTINLPAGLADQGWQATVDNSGGLTPNVSATSGSSGDSLTIDFDTTGLATGVYTAAVTIQSDSPTIDSPQTLNLTVFVVDQIYRVDLPYIGRP